MASDVATMQPTITHRCAAFAARAMASAIPGARYALLHKAGHSGHFERAAAFNALVDAFFEEIGA